jgi:hypothetical protein
VEWNGRLVNDVEISKYKKLLLLTRPRLEATYSLVSFCSGVNAVLSVTGSGVL